MGVVEARQMHVLKVNDRAFKVTDGLDTWMVLVLKGRVHCNCGVGSCDHRLAIKFAPATSPTATHDAKGGDKERGGTQTQVETGVTISPSTTPPSLSVEDPRWYRHDNRGLPNWLTQLRPHQVSAVEQIRDAFDNGADVVFVEAPTGAGKTIIGELARRDNGVTGVYVCSGLDLQKQFAKDFQYAATVKGRSNYPTLTPGSWPDITAADCDKEQVGDGYKCTWCGGETFNCPYELAKQGAVRSKLANVNTTYALTEWNYVGGLSGRDVVIVDEADKVEGEVMGFVEFTIGPRVVKELGLQIPKKGVHAGTIETWLRDDVLPVAKAKLATLGKQGGASVQTVRAKKMYASLVQDIGRVLAAGVNFGDAGDGGWVRVYESRGSRGRRGDVEDRFTLKPIKVGEVARKVLWPHGRRWVLMSATLVSVDEMVDSLGLRELEVAEVDWEGAPVFGDDGKRILRPARWEEVHIPAVFDVENRQIVASGVANMSRKGQEAGGLNDLLWGIGVVLREHADENVLIHTHTYALAKEITREYGRHPALNGRRVWTYQDSRDRGDSLDGFKRDGGVLIAPSMDRGIDLPGDECRVQVICKMPMPYLGDAQISARLKTRGGELWYAAQTARGLIQMTGRAVRSVDDWATTYVLDSTFGQWKKRNKGLLPKWWQDAVSYVPHKLFEDEVRKRADGHRERMSV